MSAQLTEEDYKNTFANYNEDQLKTEYLSIISIPNARTNIEALTRMSALIQEYEKRGITMPGQSASSGSNAGISASRPTQQASGFDAGSFIFGLILIFGGIALSMNSGSVFYGAVIVGIGMVIKSFI